MTHIILLSGKQGAGKSSTAREISNLALKSERFSHVEIRKFAEPLYDLHDLILNKMQEWTGKLRAKKDGRLLQLLGTEWGREVFGANIWVETMRRRLSEYEMHERLIIIDDCRFENEFDAFPEALRVRLWASEDVRKARTESWRADVNHPSEIGLDAYEDQGKFDLILSTEAPGAPEGFVANEILLALDQFQFKKLNANNEGLNKPE
jgi:hypothetical protein